MNLYNLYVRYIHVHVYIVTVQNFVFSFSSLKNLFCRVKIGVVKALSMHFHSISYHLISFFCIDQKSENFYMLKICTLKVHVHTVIIINAHTCTCT